MFNSSVLETAIGIIFLFLVASLVVMAAQEFVTSVMKLRAAVLVKGLETLLASNGSTKDLYEKIISHPLVAITGVRPSYIATEHFSTAVMDTLGVRSNLVDAYKALKIRIGNLPDGRLRTVLSSLCREGETDVRQFEKRLQDWFDQGMDRVSGEYKRYAQWISLGLGVAVAFGFGIDAIAAADTLWKEPALREALTRASAEYLQQPQGSSPNLTGLMASFSDFGFRPIWTGGLRLAALPGCAITALAVTLGAPFWFDTLKQLVNIRGAGPKPDSK